jgi:plastocyanin
MKKLKIAIPKLFFILILLGFVSFAITNCNSVVGPRGEQKHKQKKKKEYTVSFDSGTIKPGDTFTYTFGTFISEGSFPYYDAFHSMVSMRGDIAISTDADYKRDTLLVVMQKNTFQPSCPKVRPGTTIKWVNKDTVNHNVTSGILSTPPSK